MGLWISSVYVPNVFCFVMLLGRQICETWSDSFITKSDFKIYVGIEGKKVFLGMLQAIHSPHFQKEEFYS